MKRNRALLLAAVVIGFVSLAACGQVAAPTTVPAAQPGGPTSAPQQSPDVTIQDFSFSPASITSHVGQKITWTNKGPSPHTATSDTGAWDSGTLNPGATFSWTPNSAGTFTYHCSIHSSMKGTVVVMP